MPSDVHDTEGSTRIVEFSFYPTPEQPRWGLLHVLTDAYSENPWGRRGTMRGDPNLVRAFKQAYQERGQVLTTSTH